MLEAIKQHVQQYFVDDRFTYHSMDHTRRVLNDLEAIAKEEKVKGGDLELLQIATLFHDTGYTANPTFHEEIGADLAADYLRSINYPENRITTIQQLILVTKLDIEPSSTLECIISDADLAHVGSEEFGEISELLRKEISNIEHRTFTPEEWQKSNLGFLNIQKWHSDGAKKLFNKGKKSNVKRLKASLKEEKKKKEKDIPEKGIETMYRVALRNHNQLSKIADNKANIMLSITAIMMSLILSSLAPKIDANPRLLIPTILIVTVNLITMFFAIMATRPKVSSTPYTRERFLDSKVNILFFGNFYKMPLEEFEWGMKHLMEDRDLLYNSLSKDLYFLGSVLAKKYGFLQYAYVVFMGGLIISTIAFVWAFLG
ncbi:MAG: putative metal-dependent HD superfamily phosphohydrolase [Saprospiraceae bacterium]|jgi:predicted metal-dependent HD superfamily phosphohydrolase